MSVKVLPTFYYNTYLSQKSFWLTISQISILLLKFNSVFQSCQDKQREAQFGEGSRSGNGEYNDYELGRSVNT
jgi:hypothetical protein